MQIKEVEELAKDKGFELIKEKERVIFKNDLKHVSFENQFISEAPKKFVEHVLDKEMNKLS